MTEAPSLLQEKLIGTWRLRSYIAVPVDGSEPSHPMGDDAQGIIMYTPDGYMSAQIMAAGRPAFASGDWFEGSDEEYRAEARGYIAYSGPYKVDEQEESLTHTMEVSLFPNWLHQTQPRVITLEGNTLKLSTASPMRSDGKTVNSYLTWERVS